MSRIEQPDTVTFPTTKLSPKNTLALMADRVPARRRMQCVGLFAGIGGVELGLQRAGHESLLLCELDPGAVSVLEQHFPGVKLARDVRTVRSLPSDTELLAAGFPCQDLSQAGQTRGIGGKNSGLISEVFRLLERKRVPNVLLENVPFMLQLGRGRAMEHIVSTVERLGYTWAYRVIDSRSFGLPQRRQRVIFLASRTTDPRTVLLSDETGPPESTERDRGRPACGFYWTEGTRGLGWAEDAVPTLKGGSTIGIPSPPAIWLPSGEIVQPDIRDAERLQGFEPDWTKVSETVTRASHRWKLVGNAVTVDVAQWVGFRLGVPGSPPVVGTPLPVGAPWPNSAWNIGEGRFASTASEWPIRRPRVPLAEFLRHKPRPLSVRATLGFYGRFKASTLRKPAGFVEALEVHLRRMSTILVTSRKAS